MTVKPGDIMEDDSILLGYSPDTGRHLFAAPSDAEFKEKFDKALQYVQKLNEEKFLGHNDWRLPTIGELNVLTQNKYSEHLRNTFNAASEIFGPNEYWSSSLSSDGQHVETQVFDRVSSQRWQPKKMKLCVRCVR